MALESRITMGDRNELRSAIGCGWAPAYTASSPAPALEHFASERHSVVAGTRALIRRVERAGPWKVEITNTAGCRCRRGRWLARRGRARPMTDRQLHARNAALTALLARAGVEAQASAVAAQLQTVLVEEIHPPMTHMLAMVTAVVRQSMRAAAPLAEAEATISARLMAMSNAHELLLK